MAALGKEKTLQDLPSPLLSLKILYSFHLAFPNLISSVTSTWYCTTLFSTLKIWFLPTPKPHFPTINNLLKVLSGKITKDVLTCKFSNSSSSPSSLLSSVFHTLIRSKHYPHVAQCFPGCFPTCLPLFVSCLLNAVSLNLTYFPSFSLLSISWLLTKL